MHFLHLFLRRKYCYKFDVYYFSLCLCTLIHAYESIKIVLLCFLIWIPPHHRHTFATMVCSCLVSVLTYIDLVHLFILTHIIVFCYSSISHLSFSQSVCSEVASIMFQTNPSAITSVFKTPRHEIAGLVELFPILSEIVKIPIKYL